MKLVFDIEADGLLEGLLRCDYSHSGGPVFVDVSSGRLMMLPFNRAITPVLQASLEADGRDYSAARLRRIAATLREYAELRELLVDSNLTE